MSTSPDPAAFASGYAAGLEAAAKACAKVERSHASRPGACIDRSEVLTIESARRSVARECMKSIRALAPESVPAESDGDLRLPRPGRAIGRLALNAQPALLPPDVGAQVDNIATLRSSILGDDERASRGRWPAADVVTVGVPRALVEAYGAASDELQRTKRARGLLTAQGRAALDALNDAATELADAVLDAARVKP